MPVLMRQHLSKEIEMQKSNKKELVCIRCPIGCRMTVTKNKDGNLSITGNTCKRGEEYARKELTNPTRIITSTVRIKGSSEYVVPVKTKGEIPKEKIKDCMEALKLAEAEVPIQIGDIVLENAANTGVAVVATKNIKQKR